MGIGLIGYLEGYILVTEIIPQKYLIYVTAGIIIIDQLLNQILPTLYFLVGFKDWFTLYLVWVILISVP